MYQVMFGLLSCCHQNTPPGVLHVWGVRLLGEQDSLRVQFHYRCCIGYSWIVFMSWHRARKSHQFDPDTLAQTVRAPITLHHWWLEPLHMLTAYRLHKNHKTSCTKLCNFIHCLPIASQFLYTCIYPSSASPSWLLQSKKTWQNCPLCRQLLHWMLTVDRALAALEPAPWNSTWHCKCQRHHNHWFWCKNQTIQCTDHLDHLDHQKIVFYIYSIKPRSLSPPLQNLAVQLWVGWMP